MTFNFAQKNRNMRILKFIVTFILLMGSVSNSLAQVSSGRLKDKVAIVTGAASGNGKAIAVLFANEGAKVILADINGIEVRKIADTLQQNQSDVIPVEVDVTREDDVQRMINSALGRFGRIDILVNNAGLTRDNLFIRMSDEDWQLVLDVNLSAGFKLAKAAVRGMMKRRFGRIIGIASVVGVTGNAGQANYSASKAGMIAMNKCLAQEVGSRGITVNSIAPGFIRTPMTDVLPEDVKAALLAKSPQYSVHLLCNHAYNPRLRRGIPIYRSPRSFRHTPIYVYRFCGNAPQYL